MARANFTTPQTKAQAHTQTQSSTVGPFWSDDDHRPEWKSGTTFLIREFVNQPPMPWYKRNQDIWRELFFFVILLGVGGLVISYNESLINRNEFISSMFFASGFIPLIQSFIFDFIPRIMTRITMMSSSSSSNSTSNKTQQQEGGVGQETFSTLLSAIFLIAALFTISKSRG
jgi:Amino acid transporters